MSLCCMYFKGFKDIFKFKTHFGKRTFIMNVSFFLALLLVVEFVLWCEHNYSSFGLGSIFMDITFSSQYLFSYLDIYISCTLYMLGLKFCLGRCVLSCTDGPPSFHRLCYFFCFYLNQTCCAEPTSSPIFNKTGTITKRKFV